MWIFFYFFIEFIYVYVLSVWVAQDHDKTKSDGVKTEINGEKLEKNISTHTT